MKTETTYLVVWLTLQWLFTGPVGAMLSMMLFFSDSHGLPNAFWPVSLIIFVIATLGYVVALRIVLRRKSV